jgi:hypothetical protein
MTRVLRTPDERFADLPDYPFAPNYIDIEDQGSWARCVSTMWTRGREAARSRC